MKDSSFDEFEEKDFEMADFETKEADSDVEDRSDVTEEEDSKQELSAYFTSLKKESKSYENRNNSNYWGCIIFDTKAQRDAFFEAIGWDVQAPYIDGVVLARKLGIELPDGWKVKIPGPDPKYAELALNQSASTNS